MRRKMAELLWKLVSWRRSEAEKNLINLCRKYHLADGVKLVKMARRIVKMVEQGIALPVEMLSEFRRLFHKNWGVSSMRDIYDEEEWNVAQAGFQQKISTC